MSHVVENSPLTKWPLQIEFVTPHTTYSNGWARTVILHRNPDDDLCRRLLYLLVDDSPALLFITLRPTEIQFYG